MSEKYFRLNPECYLVMGAVGAVVHNLYSGQALWCDHDNSLALARGEANQPVDPEAEPFRDLLQRQWGFVASQPPFVDKLRTFNVFRERRIWKETPYVSLAVLQVSGQCVRACPDCAQAFCPICVLRPGQPDAAPLATGQWLELIRELARFGAQAMVFTGGEALLNPDLPALARQAREAGVASVQVHTSGLLPLPPDLPEVAFSVLLTATAELPAIRAHLGDRVQVSILNRGAPEDQVRQVLGPQLTRGWRLLTVSPEPPRIGQGDLVQTGFERFWSRKSGDSCLNGKIYVAHDGAVLPCFGHKGAPVAHLGQGWLPAAVKALVETTWTVPIDQADQDRKCVRCEFRYACNACRYLPVEERCAYDADRGFWRSPTAGD